MPDVEHIDPNQAVLMVIDFQEKLLPLIVGKEAMMRRASVAVRAAKVLEIPVVWTEQYVKGVGPTDANLKALLEDAGTEAVEKMTFSCCGVAPVKDRLAELARPQVLVVGMETQVCVQQTVLDLLIGGYRPYLLVDATGSRKAAEHDIAVRRMENAGAIVTTVESAIFDMMKIAGTATFKAMLKIIKED